MRCVSDRFQVTQASPFEVMQICDVKLICVVHRFKLAEG